MGSIGKREQALRDMREQRIKSSKGVAKAVAAMAKPAADEPQAEVEEMRTKTSKGKAKANARSGVRGKSKHGSKTEKLLALLARKEGCTRSDALKATGWPSISLPATAKAAGVKLKREKAKGQPTRYYAA